MMEYEEWLGRPSGVESTQKGGNAMKKQRVYIAGKMRGIEYYNFPAFDEARDRLTAQGYDVVSPADLDRERGVDPMELPVDHDWNCVPDGFDFDACVRHDVDAILSCDAVYLLDSWTDSCGARAEKALAEWRGKSIMYESEAPAIFPEDAQERKTYPILTGLLSYFPHACAAVAHHSFVSNEQHNPGEPMHWAPEKSIGDGNQIARHLMEGELEACAWRALELLERKLIGIAPFNK
jgi:hypothetical protein